MIKIVLSVIGAYIAARHVKNIWLAFPAAIAISLMCNILLTIVLTQALPEASEEAVYGMVAGLVWYPVIAIIAFVVFRISMKKKASRTAIQRYLL